MEQAATTGPRVPLLTGRLQIEEGRVNDMGRRLDAARDAETSAAPEVGDLQARFDTLNQINLDDPNQPARSEVAAEKEQVKRHLAQAQAALDAKRAEDTELQSDMQTEQARWTAISQQLDALDRELSKRQGVR